ncbi:TIGR04104 family putative zinc finger protein [Robiginitalea sp. IMCC43444]|uniref:TIGR04104 family putative zinc finger protein n=1 Tax=Robiginitalea sp. IMCC43444 TaxID=3459121 RepID=UPI00404166AA
MKKCASCNNQFSIKQLLRSAWLGYEKINCQHCEAIYEHSFFNRVLVSLISIMPIVIAFIIVEYYDLNYSISFMLLSVALFILIALISMRYLKFRRVD